MNLLHPLRRKPMIALVLALALLSGACSTSTMTSRRAESREAALLTQGPLRAVDLHAVASVDAAVAEYEVVWLDAGRGRVVPAHVFMPAGGSASPLPLVVFSHGLGGSRTSYSSLGRHWAAEGFISVHLQHAGSDRAIWTASGLAVLSALRAAATPENAIARAYDVRFAIDQVLADPRLAARVDASRIAIAGHSFGANTALLVAGAQFRLDGQMQAFGDDRVRAAIILSPPSLPSDQDPVYAYNPIRIPTLHLTGTRDDTPIPGLSTMADQRSEAFDAMVATPRYLGVYQDGRHSMFHDRTRDALSSKIKRSAMTLTTAFLRASLLQDAQAAQLLAGSEQRQAEPVIARWEARAPR